MTEENKALNTKISIILLVLLPVFVIIGFFTDLLSFSVIYIMIWLSYLGILGGKWLWKELTSSEIFKSGVPLVVKIIGSMVLLILFVFIGIGFFLFYNGEETLVRQIVQQGTILMLYIAFYNIGYLISIWKPLENPIESEKATFKIKKKLSLIVLIVIIIYVLSCFVILLFITGEMFSIFFQYMALGGFGLALGWIFWEHLKESDILSGKFLNDLKILSVIFEIPVVIVMILGIISNIIILPLLDKFILLSYLLLFYLMAAYFIGLMSETMKK